MRGETGLFNACILGRRQNHFPLYSSQKKVKFYCPPDIFVSPPEPDDQKSFDH